MVARLMTPTAEAASWLAGRRVLVTGASGFIGSHLLPALVATGARVHALVRSARPPSWPYQIDAHVCDLRDHEAVGRAVAAADPSCVFHLAAYGTTGAQPDTERMFQVNVEGTRALWSALGTRKCRLVHTGSCGEYGTVAGPISESLACCPQASYPATVHAAITLSQAAAFETGREVVILRPFGPYGPGDRPERLVPYVVRRLLAGETADVTAGDQVRDYSFVGDHVRALLLAATRPLARVAPVYNIGGGRPITVRALLTAIADTVGPHATPLLAFGARPNREHDPPEMYADVTAAERELGYSPSVSLEEGLRRTVAWYRNGAGARGVTA
jgi:nucleoside-diphosphate-sugar epimerase